MNISAKIAVRFPHLHRRLRADSPSLRGLHELGFSPSLHKNRGVLGGFAKRMAFDSNGSAADLAVDTGNIRPALETHAEEAIRAIKAQKVIAVPTDTIYGFACDACSADAVKRIYEIKGRKHTSPLAICVGDVSDITRFAETNHLPDGLLDKLLPGPVTVVLDRGDRSILEKSLNPGLDSIGVRVPDSNFIRKLASGSGSALALTSANLSGQPSSVSINEFENLWHHCAYIYDGGMLPAGRAGSTVVDLTQPGLYKILRPGSAMEETVKTLEKFGIQKDQ
ncbi:hypothetical protein H6P81_011708 [Aristolochia fimbriata]|uniref:Threonylcarbamoyl-AMP synthase n=1 Tax=Aristolochia fimbriata TaxID=158543 RepID=A0AAV7E9Q8_ARIFI|nr:hypothetical protein H6P81_011708 [Aristolochia fimbriata]